MIIVLFAKSQVSHHLPKSRSRPLSGPTSMKKHHFMQKPIFSLTKMYLVGLILTKAWISGCTIYSEHSVPDLYPHKGKNIL